MAKKHKKYLSTRMKAERVKELVRQHYEPGRQDKCLMWVYRHVVKPATGISERSYWRYLDEMGVEKAEEDPNQLKLF
jgi:hypothetical protein